MEQTKQRLLKIKNNLKKKDLLPYFISSLINIRYLTGFTGSHAYLLIDKNKIFFISDSRYEEYARSILPEPVEFVNQKSDFIDAMKGILNRIKTKRLCLEEHSLTFSNYLMWKKNLKGIRLEPGGDEVDIIRLSKDDGELEQIRKAARITDKCFSHLLKFIKPGMKEWDIAIEIEYFYRKNGCTKTSFDSIVASGQGTSMPHYETSMNKKVKSGDVLLIDMGCIYNGYNSDLTRTIFLDSITPEFKRIYSIVLKAQKSAIASIRPGTLSGRIDKIARDIISNEGFGEKFGHSLGHGVGLEVHELPALKPAGTVRLKKNMVVTVEPGIYIPKSGGVRIEDMVLVSAKGADILTKSKKEIIII